MAREVIEDKLRWSTWVRTQAQALRALRDFQWVRARKIDKVVRQALEAGYVGMTATLSLPANMAAFNACPPRRLSRMIDEVEGRWRKLLEGEVRRVWYLWALEPHTDGLPHAHVLAMVPADQVERAFDLLALSVFEPTPGKPARPASRRVLRDGDPVTRDQIPPPGSRDLLGWLGYMLKGRIMRDPGEGRAGLATLLGWTKFFGVGRALRGSPTKGFDKRLERWMAKELAAKDRRKAAGRPTSSPVTETRGKVITGIAGASSGAPASNGAAMDDVPAPANSSRDRVRRQRERNKATGLVRVSAEGVPARDAAVVRAVAAAAKAGECMVEAAARALAEQGRDDVVTPLRQSLEAATSAADRMRDLLEALQGELGLVRGALTGGAPRQHDAEPAWGRGAIPGGKTAPPRTMKRRGRGGQT